MAEFEDIILPTPLEDLRNILFDLYKLPQAQREIAIRSPLREVDDPDVWGSYFPDFDWNEYNYPNKRNIQMSPRVPPYDAPYVLRHEMQHALDDVPGREARWGLLDAALKRLALDEDYPLASRWANIVLEEPKIAERSALFPMFPVAVPEYMSSFYPELPRDKPWYRWWELPPQLSDEERERYTFPFKPLDWQGENEEPIVTYPSGRGPYPPFPSIEDELLQWMYRKWNERETPEYQRRLAAIEAEGRIREEARAAEEENKRTFYEDVASGKIVPR